MNQFSSFKWSVVVIVLHWRVDNYPWTALSGKDCLSSELGCLYCSPDISWLLLPLVTSLNVSQQSRYGFSMETYRLQLWREMGVRLYQKPIPKRSPILQYAPNPSSIYVKIRWWNQIHSKHECLYECLPAFSLEVCEEMVDSSIHQTAFSSLTQQQH